jgi:hypothetical protein
MSERFILIGILLFVVVLLPLLLVWEVRQRRKVRRILKSHRQQREPESSRKEKEEKSDLDGIENQGDPDAPRGWGMNNSPFRSRKSGLTWGGGNIKASEAKRGTRRKFLDR